MSRSGSKDRRSQMPRLIPALLLLSFLSPLSLWAQAEGIDPGAPDAFAGYGEKECGTILLSENALGPIRNQHERPWCVAYAAADLLSYDYGRPVSALDVALTAIDGMSAPEVAFRKIFFSTKGVWGGLSIKKPLQKTAEHGPCAEEALPSNDYQPHVSVYLEAKTRPELLRQLDTTLGYRRRNATLLGMGLRTDEDSVVYTDLPYLPYDSIQKILQTTEPGLPMALEIRDKACEGHRLTSKKISVVSRTSVFNYPSQLLREMNRELEKQNLVAVGFYEGLLVEPTAVKLGEGHEVSVVGRQWRNGQCKFLIRNSWGEYSCPRGSGLTECDSQRPGHFWVESSVLGRFLNGITYIPK